MQRKINKSTVQEPKAKTERRKKKSEERKNADDFLKNLLEDYQSLWLWLTIRSGRT